VRILADQAIVPADELGNEIPSDIAWQFIVQRSGFSWNPVNLVVVASRGVERVIETRLTNGNTDDIDVTIDGPLTLDLLDAGGNPTGTTVDLDPSVVAATLPAGGSHPVQFTIPDTLALGRWFGQIGATASRGGVDLGTATFFADVNVACAAPAWTVDPAAFEYTMSLTAELFVDGIASTDANDFVAAYVNGQVRGVGQNMPVGGGAFRVSMLLYSNDALGEVVTFQVWDDDQCTLYQETSLAVSFLADTGQGTLEAPVTLEAPPPATTGTTLAAEASRRNVLVRGVPLNDLIKHPAFDTARLTSLAKVGFAGAPMPNSVMERLLELFPEVEFTGHFLCADQLNLTFQLHNYWFEPVITSSRMVTPFRFVVA